MLLRTSLIGPGLFPNPPKARQSKTGKAAFFTITTLTVFKSVLFCPIFVCKPRQFYGKIATFSLPLGTSYWQTANAAWEFCFYPSSQSSCKFISKFRYSSKPLPASRGWSMYWPVDDTPRGTSFYFLSCLIHSNSVELPQAIIILSLRCRANMQL